VLYSFREFKTFSSLLQEAKISSAKKPIKMIFSFIFKIYVKTTKKAPFTKNDAFIFENFIKN
jgi:hypothetical protein